MKTGISLKALIGLTALFFLGSYSTPQIQLPNNSMPVPIVRQSTDFSCGAASLLAILQYWNVYDGTETSLFPRLGTTPQEGTRNEEIVRVAKELGLHAEAKAGSTVEDLRRALTERQTVILDIQAWRDDPSVPWKEAWEDGHYVVLVGMDSQFLYLMDPVVGTSYTYLPIKEFLERWHDYEVYQGKATQFHQLAIFLSGKTSLSRFPAALSPTE